ncbi:MAG: hypothetical protein Q7S61_04635 [bacterium]|nr:hypothetical protein [bacterium]
MNTIRLTVTPEIRDVLDVLKRKYPPLSEPEILKVALSEFYTKTTQHTIDIKNLTNQGRKYFSAWLKKQGKEINTLSEEDAYDLIKNA